MLKISLVSINVCVLVTLNPYYSYGHATIFTIVLSITFFWSLGGLKWIFRSTLKSIFFQIINICPFYYAYERKKHVVKIYDELGAKWRHY